MVKVHNPLYLKSVRPYDWLNFLKHSFFTEVAFKLWQTKFLNLKTFKRFVKSYIFNVLSFIFSGIKNISSFSNTVSRLWIMYFYRSQSIPKYFSPSRKYPSLKWDAAARKWINESYLEHVLVGSVILQANEFFKWAQWSIVAIQKLTEVPKHSIKMPAAYTSSHYVLARQIGSYGIDFCAKKKKKRARVIFRSTLILPSRRVSESANCWNNERGGKNELGCCSKLSLNDCLLVQNCSCKTNTHL